MSEIYYVHTLTNVAWSSFCHSSLCALERRAPHCPADESDVSPSLLKALEADSESPPWPSLHVNMDNKVRHCPYKPPHPISAHKKLSIFFTPCSPARERRSSCPKSLFTLLTPRRCSLTVLSVTSSKPRWRRPSGWVPMPTSPWPSKPCVLCGVNNSSNPLFFHNKEGSSKLLAERKKLKRDP